jgi:hypothetical protein
MQRQTDQASVPSEQLSDEEARAAIIALVEHSKYEELKMSVPFLRKTEIGQVGTDSAVVHIGKWQFNLKKRTFIVAIDAPPIFAEYRGIFEKTPHKGWTASFTDVKQN